MATHHDRKPLIYVISGSDHSGWHWIVLTEVDAPLIASGVDRTRILACVTQQERAPDTSAAVLTSET